MTKKIAAIALVALAILLSSQAPSDASGRRMETDSCDPGVHATLRLYRAFFDRDPDPAGADYWSDTYRNGSSLDDIRWAFGQSPEFARTYSGSTDADYVTSVYRNALDRTPDPVGHAYWTGELASGRIDRVGLVAFVSQAPEFARLHPVAAPSYCQHIARVSGHEVSELTGGVTHARSGAENVAFVDPALAQARVDQGRGTVGRAGGFVAINGNWFGGSCGVFDGYSRAAGVTYGGGQRDIRSAYLAVAGGRVEIRDYYSAGTDSLPEWATDALGGKILVVDGGRADWLASTTDATFTRRAPRTAAGLTSDGALVLVTVDGRSKGPGATGVEMADRLVELGAVTAVMLDGGGSTTMAVNGQVVNQPSDGSTRSVANQLVIG